MSQKEGNESKFRKCIRAPIRILRRARDFYIRGITECSGNVSYGNVMGLPTGHISTLPKSFSVNSSRSSVDDEDHRELVRAASTKRTLEIKEEKKVRLQQQLQRHSSPAAKGLPRSCSVGIGRIDEDKPCDFGEDVKARTDLMYPRSRSYAATKRSGVFA